MPVGAHRGIGLRPARIRPPAAHRNRSQCSRSAEIVFERSAWIRTAASEMARRRGPAKRSPRKWPSYQRKEIAARTARPFQPWVMASRRHATSARGGRTGGQRFTSAGGLRIYAGRSLTSRPFRRQLGARRDDANSRCRRSTNRCRVSTVLRTVSSRTRTVIAVPGDAARSTDIDPRRRPAAAGIQSHVNAGCDSCRRGGAR